jgi:L,D-transpeptidase catalytic domain
MTALPSRKILTLVGALSAAVFSASCSNQMTGGSLAEYHAYDLPTKLPKDPSKVRVKVSLSKQRTYVMEGSEMLLAMPVSVGDAANPTPRGNFTIYAKHATKRANSHGFAFRGDQVLKTYLAQRPSGWSFKGTPMPYWCEFKPNYGFHTGWIKHHPCTHGCIRMHENLSPKFFRLVSNGTPVNIAYSQPEDQTHGSIPLPPDSGPLPDYPGSMYLGDGYFRQHKTPAFQ